MAGALLAFAATQPAVAQPAGVFNWSGFYVGGQAGYGWGETQHFDAGAPLEKFDIKGWAGGGTVGYNWQFGGAWMLGLEADLSHSAIGGSDRAQYLNGGGACVCVTEVNWFATARVRTGAVVGQSLLYVTGGIAYGDFFVRFDNAMPGDSLKRTGWTGGAGWEYAFAPNWSAKLEYLYVDFGKFRYQEDPVDIDHATAKFHFFRLGVNYRFAYAPY